MSVRTTKSGKTIADGADYTAIREETYKRQNGRCSDCGRRKDISEMELHHADKRGAGKRDDADPENKLLCQWCHRGRHGQAR